MVLNRIFEFCRGCDTDIDVPTWDDLYYCKECGEGPFCEKCKDQHKIYSELDNPFMECFPHEKKK